MSGRVELEVVEGPMKGQKFAFEEHDTFVFGRLKDCHARLPDDQQVSRHHFIMEANPPDARVRDLGSMNGTHINGTKYGSREKGETPEEGAEREYPQVDLKNGDQIRVGRTLLVVSIEVPAVCCQCSCDIADKDRDQCIWIGGTFICAPCKQKLAASAKPAKAPEPVRCKKCKKDVSKEIGEGRRGDYICQSCQAKAEDDPHEILQHMIALLGDRDKPPVIEGLKVGKLLGKGGFGAVYLARRKKDDAQMALKVMLSKVAVTKQARETFLREIELTKQLKHKNIVTLLDHGSTGSAFYFLMDYYDGGSVDDLMEQHGGKIPLSEAAPVMLQTLEGLSYVHGQSVVHRDLKPGNILLAGSGSRRVAKVSDLGLGKNYEKAGFSGMTITGGAAGTPPFMPREQVTNFKYVKPTCDVWSIAATYYNMLTGQFPRDFRRGRDMMQAVLQSPVVPIRRRNSSIPSRVAGVIDKALAEKPKDRYQDAGEMLKAMTKVL